MGRAFLLWPGKADNDRACAAVEPRVVAAAEKWADAVESLGPQDFACFCCRLNANNEPLRAFMSPIPSAARIVSVLATSSAVHRLLLTAPQTAIAIIPKPTSAKLDGSGTTWNGATMSQP